MKHNVDLWNETLNYILKSYDTEKYITKSYNFSNIKQISELNKNYTKQSKCLVVNSNCLNLSNLDLSKKIALLNFANPKNPACGVPKDNTQEEFILRNTNLSLYLYNINTLHSNNPTGNNYYPLKSGELLYSKNVKIIRDIKTFQFLNTSINIDIITGASLIGPQIIKQGNELCYKNIADYNYMYNYIELIFQSAIDNNVDILILGAFGCGAFSCPPHQTAQIFNYFCQKYKSYFDLILFPIINDIRGIHNFNIFSQYIKQF